jgi:serine/threonine protein kinase
MAHKPNQPRDDEVTADFTPGESPLSNRKSAQEDETADFSYSELTPVVPPTSSSDLEDSDLDASDLDDRDLESGDPRPSGSDGDISGPALPRFGRYVLLELLGRGGMGEVYRALHTRLHKQVALKLLPKGKAASRQARERFEREIQLISRLSHKNVVRLENAGEIDGQPYLIMEYVAGLNLKQLVARAGPLRVPDACQLVGQAAAGLAHLHQHQLVHRDIKPSNLIFCSLDGSVKIADLGVARLAEGISEITQSGKIVGDPHYMAPEQIEGRKVDTRVDIYGLGCTLFTLLTGKPPFNEVAGDIPEVLKGHLHRRFPRLATRCPEASTALQRVLDQMTARDPEQRLALPHDVIAALTPFAVGCDLQKLNHTVNPTAEAFGSGSISGIHTAEYLSLQRQSAPFDKPHKEAKWVPVALVAGFLVVAAALLLYSFGVFSL